MSDFGGFSAEIFSGIAVAISSFNLWYSTLRRPRFQAFASPTARYASPYQRSIFEVFEIPLTITNDGARTGTILTFNMEVTSPKGVTKQFYSAGLGSWNLGKGRGEGLEPFTPVALPGHTSHSAIVLFYAREDSTVMQIVEEPGRFSFAIRMVTAEGKISKPLKFDMNLPFIDARAFTSGSGTLPLHHPEWQAASAKG